MSDAANLREFLRPGEGLRGDAFARAHLFGQVIGKPAGELEDGFSRDVVADEAGGAFPADLYPCEQIRLRAGEREQPLWGKAAITENLGVRHEGDSGAAPVGRGPEVLDRALGDPARKLLRVKLLVARHFDPGVNRQRIDHAYADPVQAPAGGIGLARKLAARVQRCKDHFERRLARELGMLLDRDAAAVVGNRQAVAFVQTHLDARRMACDRLVHRIVEHFGGEMVEGAVIRPADIHPWAAAHRLQTFKHLDCGGVVIAARCRGIGEEIVGRVTGHSANV